MRNRKIIYCFILFTISFPYLLSSCENKANQNKTLDCHGTDTMDCSTKKTLENLPLVFIGFEDSVKIELFIGNKKANLSTYMEARHRFPNEDGIKYFITSPIDLRKDVKFVVDHKYVFHLKDLTLIKEPHFTNDDCWYVCELSTVLINKRTREKLILDILDAESN